MRCPSCNFENLPQMKFCGECGRRLADPSPGEARDARAYTPKHLAEKILTSRSAIEGERKQVTVLFADVKGSMELASEVDPEEWHAILDRFFQILGDGIHRFEGTINQYTGDGIMALFGAPIAHEDHAQRACYAALHLRDALRRYADELRVERELNFAVRMGLNSGDVVVGKIGDDLRMDYTAQGHTVGLAQRMEQLAEPGRPLLTEHTAKLVREFFTLRDVGESRVKGVSEPLRLYELEGTGKYRTRFDVSRARGLSRFVGRAEEMETLERALAEALTGAGRAIGVVAEPGVGKSRLCHEFIERCRVRGVRVTPCHGVPHGKAIPLLPWLEQRRNAFGLADDDSDETKRNKIAGRMLRLDPDLGDEVPIMFEFLGVPDPLRPAPRLGPEALQRRLIDLTKRLVLARARRGEPAVLLFEDVHWFDPASETFLAAMVEVVGETPSLMLCTFRPEYQAAWMESASYQPLPLVPLGREAHAELLRHLLGPDPSVAALTEHIQERTAGNPFFTEEVVRALVEAGTLTGATGAYRLERPVEELTIPPTVQSVLAARIDRLSDEEKALLQTAAVIGKTFLARVLRVVSDLSEEALAAALDRLARAEFLHETALYPEAEYAFEHPLTQEVAYRSQLASRRTRLHGAVARALVELFADRAGENAALLAHHWEAADEPLEAARSHGRAADWIGLRDVAAADRHWRRVPELLRDEPSADQVLRLRLLACERILAVGWRLRMPMEEADRVLADGRELSVRLADRGALARLVAAHAAHGTLFGADVEELRKRATEAMVIAEEIGDRGLRVGLSQLLTWVAFYRADPSAGIEVTARGIELAGGDPELGRDLMGFSPLSSMHCLRAFFLMFLGRLAEAKTEFERAIARGREIDDDDSTQFPLGQMSGYAYFSGDAAAALPSVAECLEITARSGHRWGLAMAYSCLGHTYLAAGEWSRALEALEEEERLTDAGDSAYGRSWLLEGLALARLHLGDRREALHLAEEAVRAAENRWPYPEAVALITLSRAVRAVKGRAARAELETIHRRLDAIIAETGMVGFRPFVEVERAELTGLLGDAGGKRAKLENARRAFSEMGATGHVERLAKELER